TICMLKRLNETGAAEIRRILEERSLDEKGKDWLTEAIRSTGADEYCIDVARHFTSQAKRVLEALPDSEYKKSLFDLCDYIVARER
ncbi:MAG: hypothetical protein HY801_12790, partial [Candidatus Lindowbacteria bacterium]|nr:hypothetical protein [Candidatus Lindowbacteria bacterium]